MKITTILGSPRKKGNTAAVLQLFEARIAEAGHEINRIRLADYDVKPCRGCYRCKKVKDKPGCPQKDDFEKLYNEMAASDALVYATPLYCWCFPSGMKALIDRQISLVSDFETPEHASLIEGKKSALLVTCEGPVKGNADLIQKLFDRLMNDYLKTEVTGKYVVTGCTTPDKLPADVEKKTVKMARDMKRAFNM